MPIRVAFVVCRALVTKRRNASQLKFKLSAYGRFPALLVPWRSVSAIPKHRKLIGENIRSYRKKAGLSQEKLAEKASLHPVYISQVERADRAVTVDALLRITRALSIKLRDIVGDL